MRMKKIRVLITSEFAVFEEFDSEKNSKAIKAGKLDLDSFWKWLEDKEKINSDLTILIIKKSGELTLNEVIIQ